MNIVATSQITIVDLNDSVFVPNLLPWSKDWVAGSGSLERWTAHGDAAENVRSLFLDPFGYKNILWRCIPDADGGASGGFTIGGIRLNREKTYRFTCFIKRSSTIGGTLTIGMGNVNTLAGVSVSNAPVISFLTAPQADRWYLLVGILHPAGTTSSIGKTGIYDMRGTKLTEGVEYAFGVTPEPTFYVKLDGATTVSSEVQLFMPTLECLDGTEESIQTLIRYDGSENDYLRANIEWDSTNNAIKINGNFYATGSSSALGIGVGGGGSSYNMVSDWSQYVAGSELWVVSAELINALRTSVTGHIGDSTHASAGQKSNWNAAYSHSLVSGGVHMTTTDRSKLDGIEAQANKYIHPTKTSRSAGGASHFITAFTSDTLGHVTGITTAAMAKADVEAVLVGNTITSHYHDDRYFKKDELFTKEGSGTEADPYRIKANFPFYGVSSVSALGIGVGGGGTAYDRLDTWASYDITKAGWVLSAALGYDLHDRVSTLESSTPNIAWGVAGSGYIPLAVNGVSHQLSTYGHTHTKSSITDFAHTHDDRYYTETEVGNLFAGTTAITGYNKSNWDNVYTAFNSMQVGGRNYVLNSKHVYTAYFIIYVTGASVKAGDKLTLSADGYAGAELRLYANGGNGFAGMPQITFSGTSYERKSATFTIPALDGAGIPITYWRVYINFPTVGLIKDIKLEAGNKATDYTVAPEDVDASIATVQTNLTTHAGLTNNPHAVTASQVGLGNVENTALSTWAGSGNITALGTVTSGTWSANTIAVTKGGTGKTSVAANSMLYATGANAYGEVATTAFGRGLLSAVSGTVVSGLVSNSASELRSLAMPSTDFSNTEYIKLFTFITTAKWGGVDIILDLSDLENAYISSRLYVHYRFGDGGLTVLSAPTLTWINGNAGNTVAYLQYEAPGVCSLWLKTNTAYQSTLFSNQRFYLLATTSTYHNTLHPEITGITKITSSVNNVASALVTPRTIFGQSFDGTANVTGAMSATTAILSNLTAGYVPYHTAGGLANSPITISGNNVLTAGNLTLSSAVGTFMQIGYGRLVWDNTNNAIKVIKADGTAANFYATGSNTALGIGGGASGGGLITNVYGSAGFGGTYSDVDLSSTFNAYAINSLYTAIQGKQNTITGAISTLVSSNLYANYALVSGATGKIQASGVTATELSYLTGVTSAVQYQIGSLQTQINAKPSVNSYPTAFSWNAGSWSGPTGTLSGSNMTAVSFDAIPAASLTASGVVTTGEQYFAGEKSFGDRAIFWDHLYMRPSNPNRLDAFEIDHLDYSYCDRSIWVHDGDVDLFTVDRYGATAGASFKSSLFEIEENGRLKLNGTTSIYSVSQVEPIITFDGTEAEAIHHWASVFEGAVSTGALTASTISTGDVAFKVQKLTRQLSPSDISNGMYQFSGAHANPSKVVFMGCQVYQASNGSLYGDTLSGDGEYFLHPVAAYNNNINVYFESADNSLSPDDTLVLFLIYTL